SATTAEAETTSGTAISQDIFSSQVEQQFKGALYSLNEMEHSGSSARFETGSTAFPGLSKALPDNGPSILTVDNATNTDIVLLYFTSDNLLLDNSSKPYAVFIGKGEHYSTRFAAGFGRFNFILGNDWLRLDNSQSFVFPGRSSPSSSWQMDYYFRVPLPRQHYLSHDVEITRFEQPNNQNINAPAHKPLHEPSGSVYDESNTSATLRFVQSGNQISLKGSGTLYIYESPLRLFGGE
ncbi:MAG TPA: hypothetical protein VFR58_08900, partial [Flavisolibacter sp.]|nr:hypothetical protein [Flavisolibacter sp.]